MFDIGFLELLVIAIVGLVIIGPERLPDTARAIGLWIGRLKRSLRDTRSELERQLGADDIRRQLHNEEVMRSLEATRRQIEDAVQDGVIEDRSKSLKGKGREDKYEPEETLPDHAHGDEQSVSEAAEADLDTEPTSTGKEQGNTPTSTKPSVSPGEDAPSSEPTDSDASHSDSKKSS